MVPQGDKVRAEKHCFLYHKTIKVSHTSNSLSQELLKKFQILCWFWMVLKRNFRNVILEHKHSSLEIPISNHLHFCNCRKLGAEEESQHSSLQRPLGS